VPACGYSSSPSRSSPGSIVVLGGLAGSGKTERLHELATAGEQVLDLEALARHRGSAFGGIGLGAQPSHEAFAGLVDAAVAGSQPRRPLWVEDEGPFIGSVGVPPWLQAAIATAPVVELEAAWDERVTRLVRVYGRADPAELLHALQRSRRRLGKERTAAASACVRDGDLTGAVSAVLPVFGAAYEHRMAGLGRRVIGRTHVGAFHEPLICGA
jgi:tRNA 2-selenouridine synthase